MAAPFATPMANGAARTPLSSLNPNKSQSVGIGGAKPTMVVAATPAPQSAEANRGSASRKSLGAVPSSTMAPPPSTIINKRLSVMPPQSLTSFSSSAAATPAPSRLSIAPTPVATSQGRKSLGPGMHAPPPATPKDPRRSSVINAGGSSRGARKDPRPVGDKAYMKKQVQKIIEFLLNNNYNQAIAPQKMMSPSLPEYASWVLHLYRLVEPDFKFEGKFEEEIPNLFRALRYPIPLSKSNIQSIGAPHAVPAFIAALDWLCDSVQFLQVQMSPDASNSLNGELADPVLFDFIASAYSAYLNGDDNYSAIDDNLIATWEQRNNAMAERVEEIRKENALIYEDVKMLIEQGEKLPKLEKKRTNQQQDILKFQKHVADLEAYNKKVNAQFGEASKELSNRETERNLLQEERAQYQAIVKQQELNNIDGEKLQKERLQVEEALKSISAAKDAAEKLHWDNEMALSKALADLEKEVKSYNTIASRLALTPVTAKRARGKSFEVPFNSSRAHINEHIINQIRNEIVPGLAELKATLAAKLVTAREANLSLKETLDTTEEHISEKGEELGALENTARKTEEAYQADKDSLNEKLVIINQDTQALIADAAKLRGTLSSAMARAQKSSEMNQAEYEALIKRQTDEKEAFNNHILSVIDVLVNHKSYIADSLENLKDYYIGTQQSLLHQ